MPVKEKKLYRSKDDRIVAGVCGGIGEYFDIDPVLIRGLFAVLFLANGIGAVLYLILLVIVPNELKNVKKEEEFRQIAENLEEQAKNVVSDIETGIKAARKKGWRFSGKRATIGLGVALCGLILLFNHILPVRFLRWDLIWPMTIILIGFYLIVSGRK